MSGPKSLERSGPLSCLDLSSSMYYDSALAGLNTSSRKITDDAVSHDSVWIYP